MDLLFAGSGEFGLPTLRALIERHRIVHVYTQPDRPAGRGKKLTPTPIGAFAEANRLPLTKTPDLNAETLPPADALVVIAFGQKISPAVTEHARFGAINLHASRLPKYRGAAPIHRAIMAGENVTGNTIIRLAPKMDAGSVLGMTSLAIGELETTGELHDRLAEDGPKLVLKILDKLESETATEVEQNESMATLAKKISRETAILDFSRPAVELARLIRGLYPWPGCRVELLDAEGKVLRKLTLVRARPLPAEGIPMTPATISPTGLISTGSGTLDVVEVVPEGGNPMPLAAYRNGNPWPYGGQLRGC
jgi:methionyl-tRNA formyltransferase